MINLANNVASLNKQIPLDKMFDVNIINKYKAKELTWLMSIKPGIRNVEKYINDNIRIEEIEVFKVKVAEIPDDGLYYDFLKQIHSKVKYPSVVFFEYKNKYKITAWKFADSRRETNHNVMKTAFVSSWIYIPTESKKTKKCEEDIQEILLNGEGSLLDIYNKICQCIGACYPKCIGSATHLKKIVVDLTGPAAMVSHIDSFKKHTLKDKKSKYSKNEYYNTYHLFFEYEDIWHAFMNDEKIRKIIEKRRYRDIEDLILCIDQKYEDMENQWW